MSHFERCPPYSAPTSNWVYASFAHRGAVIDTLIFIRRLHSAREIKMLKFYFSPSTSSLATHIALLECGAAFEPCPTLMSKKETRTPAYLAINPNGKVPALVTDSGRVITEVAATLYYLARAYPDAGLWPEGDIEDEAEVVSWMSFTASTMHGARLGGAEALAEAFEIANTKLDDRQWAIGRFTIADIHLFRVYWRFRPTVDAPLGTYPALESHHDRMLARPAVQKAMEAEKEYG
ncbi:MAG: glutathione S-transferase [Rhodospirillaceae bacterium]|nr:glutathione S-transferase [Rhodospirillaceae bacterium]